MITGDHGVTARAIAQQLKICREGDLVVTGAQLDQWDDRRLKDQLDRVAVFARVTPAPQTADRPRPQGAGKYCGHDRRRGQ